MVTLLEADLIQVSRVGLLYNLAEIRCNIEVLVVCVNTCVNLAIVVKQL